jgi:adhesin transport system outer membrane protein
LLDLLDSENELFNDRSNLVTADFTEVFAVYRVLATVGTLLDTLSIDRPKQAISIYREPQEPIRRPD